jgi:hypothetical protein
MKRIILFFLVLSAAVCRADNYFVDGMKWECVVSGDAYPYPYPELDFVYETVYLEGTEIVNGVESLKMWMIRDHDESTAEVISHIYTDGDKVFFLEPYTGEWRLMYDFGMKEGSVNEITAYRTPSNTVHSSILKCASVYNSDEYGGLEVLSLDEYEYEGAEYHENGKWLNGIGSVNGVLMNSEFNYDGIGGRLLKAILPNNEVIYEYTAGVETNEILQPLNISGGNGEILVGGDYPDLAVYDTTGRRYAGTRVPAGLYIVTAGGRTAKVLVK